MSADLTDSEPEEEKGRESYTVSESEDDNKEEINRNEAEDRTDCRQDMEADDDGEDEEYDEVVLYPRPLNEVTSLTDKTSPWTSIISDSELVSLESAEEPEELNLREDEDETCKMSNLQTPDNSDQHDEPDESESFKGSEIDASDTDSEDEMTLQTIDERRAKATNTVSHEKDSSPAAHDATDTHDAPCSWDNQDSPTQVYPSSVFTVVFLVVTFL